MEVFLFQQWLAGDRSSGFHFCTDLSHTTQSQVFLICCLIAARRVMSLTYGEWLFWIWIGGIGNYLARLSFQKCLLTDVNSCLGGCRFRAAIGVGRFRVSTGIGIALGMLEHG